MDFTKLQDEQTINETIKSLNEKGITSTFVQTNEEAKNKVLELIPKGVNIMNMTSKTLDDLGISDVITNSGEYGALKTKLYSLDRNTQGREMKELGSSPEWVIGSVHAVTKDGVIMVASKTGSQLPAYAYGSDHVIWVIGANKIVNNLEEGFKRIYEHSLPLESERARIAYGTPHSDVDKILIVNKEFTSNRISMVIVNQVLGF